jgi:hypothetical protein
MENIQDTFVKIKKMDMESKYLQINQDILVNGKRVYLMERVNWLGKMETIM